jgi:HAD superfamily hydrolase (TIGR01493 family)
MPAAKYRAIIFDIGRVIIRIDVRRAMAGLAQNVSMTPEEIWSALEKHPTWLDWQEGRISPRDWHLSVTKRFGATLTFEEFTKVWNRVLDPHPILDNDFFAGLAKKYRLCLLSNTDPIHVAHMATTYDFMKFFPHRIYSCAVGASKPNPVIFQAALNAVKVSAKDTIYIDDIAAYAEAAARLGMTGLVFTGPDKLTSDLASLGV